jgi:hypothetical protein
MRVLAIVGFFVVAVAVCFFLIGGFDTGKSSAGDNPAPPAGATTSDARDIDASDAPTKRGAAVEYMVPCPNCKKRR